MKTMYRFETEGGVIERLPNVTNDEEAYAAARERYPDASREDPHQWLVKIGEDEDLFLCPGGPEGEEFTWMPRSLWVEWPQMMREARDA